jgi:hypothetical protein
MRRVAVAVALVVVLSGCNGVVGGDGARTVTPAPVPTAADDRAASPREPTECAAPRPATPDATEPAPTPTTPVPVPATGGVVEGEQLIETNAAALRNHSYRLRAGDSIRVRALAGAAAFTFRGSYQTQYLSVYAVNGTLYSVDLASDSSSVSTETYRPGAPRDNRIAPSAMVSHWLAGVVGPYNYTDAGTREWNGATVRVFRSDARRPQYVRLQRVVALDSTVYVDRRGIIRWIHHEQRYRNVLGDDNRTKWRNETLVVTDVGTARIERPPGLCRPVDG